VANYNHEQGNGRGPLIAIAAVAIIVVIAVVLVHEPSAASRLQDCLLSGRTNCAPIAPSGG